MTSTEAIETLTQLADYGRYPLTPNAEKSLNLANEALKRHRNRASLTLDEIMQPLPGETDD